VHPRCEREETKNRKNARNQNRLDEPVLGNQKEKKKARNEVQGRFTRIYGSADNEMKKGVACRLQLSVLIVSIQS